MKLNLILAGAICALLAACSPESASTTAVAQDKPAKAADAPAAQPTETPKGDGAAEKPEADPQAHPQPDAKPEADPAAEELAEPPKGTLTDNGLVFKVPYDRGDGDLVLARQNGLLRVFVDVRMPYHGGDAGRDRGSSVTLTLSVDGLHGRHLMYYPAPLWIPRDNSVANFRSEAVYDPQQGVRRLGERPSFAAEAEIAFWDHFTATIYVDPKAVVIPGNTPGSQSDEWRAAISVGSSAGNVSFPKGVQPQNASGTAKHMLTFKLSELPELEEADKNPKERIEAHEKAVNDAMQKVLANLTARDWGATFATTKNARKDFPTQLWAFHLTYLISRQAGGQGIEGVDADFLPLLKDYVDACPGQSAAHLEYLDALIAAGQEDAAFAHFKTIEKSPMCTGRKETASYMRLEWCERIIPWGYVNEAEGILTALAGDATLTKDDGLRVNLKIAQASLTERKADSARAAEIYKDLLTSERTHLSPEQLQRIQKMQQFQLQAVEQWKDELKYREADAEKKNPRWIIETSKGRIVVELFQDDSPNTVASLVSLAKKEFYDGLNFHRVEPGFVAQGGCPKGDGTGSPGYRTKFEKNNRKHFRGTVAMARSQDLNSQGSQFYICVSNGASVINLSENNYLVVGRVLEGMDVADKLRKGDKIVSIRAENLRDGEYKPEVLPELEGNPGD